MIGISNTFKLIPVLRFGMKCNAFAVEQRKQIKISMLLLYWREFVTRAKRHMQPPFILAAIFLISFALLPTSLHAQNYSTTIHKTVQFLQVNNSKNELRVYNINGSVTVVGYNGDKIQMTAKVHIKGNNRQVQRGKSDLQFEVKCFGNKILVYIKAPFAHLSHHHGHFNYEIHRDNWNWNEDDDYKYAFDILVKMPRSTAVHVSTINKGTVYARNTTGQVFASNINGNLDFAHISGEAYARTINGNIMVNMTNRLTSHVCRLCCFVTF
jgi:hypothetical protein